jgi:hypothetical protein
MSALRGLIRLVRHPSLVVRAWKGEAGLAIMHSQLELAKARAIYLRWNQCLATGRTLTSRPISSGVQQGTFF